MDQDYRLDHLIGMIYETIPVTNTITAVIDGICVEVEMTAGSAPLDDDSKTLLRGFVSRAVHRHADIADCTTYDRIGERADWFAEGMDFPWRFSADQLLLRLSIHLARSATWRNRLQRLEEQQRLRQIEIEQLSIGLIWIGSDLRVVAQNGVATMRLQEQAELYLRDGRLCSSLKVDDSRLNLALIAALRLTEPEPTVLAFRGLPEALPLLVCVKPVTLPGSLAGLAERPMALVSIPKRQDASHIRLAHLQTAYGFTTAELKLAEALANNETLDDYAHRSGIGGTTVRSHLARLFSKTGTSRQAELVRLLVLGRSFA